MNNISPDVILKLKFELAINNIDNKFKFNDYKSKRQKDVNDMINYYSNPKESATNMFDYYSGIISGNKYNLVLENGNYATAEDIKKYKKNYSKYIDKSNLWKGIISFNNQYIYDNINLKDLEQKFAKEIMPQFLKYCGFVNTKNMSYIFAIHTKSKSGHIHIHFAFIEKKENYKSYDNELVYRRTGVIDEDKKNYLKRLVALTIERDKYYTPMLIKTNKDIEEFKKYFSYIDKNFILNDIDELIIEEKILKLGSLIKEYRELNNQEANRVKFNSINNSVLGKEIKSLTRDVKKYLLQDKTSRVYNSKNKIDRDLKEINNYFNELNNSLHIKEITKETLLERSKKEYIDNYIYNSIVNHALYKYNKIYNTIKTKNKYDDITLEDLIQEIAYQNRDKIKITEKERRKRILNNYFTGIDIKNKFPNKYKMENSIKKINYEMDKASEQFEQLFNYENERSGNI